jgi:Tol biopolymer transport system component
VSIGQSGRQSNAESGAPAISADGRRVAFLSYASNLAVGDTNATSDVFVRNLETGVTLRVSVGPDGRQANLGSYAVALSADGRRVAFESSASNLVVGDTNVTSDVFVRNLETRVTRRVSVGSSARQGNGGSDSPAISADGQFVAFRSSASNLAAGDTNRKDDVFVRNRKTGVTLRVSVGPGGQQANGTSRFPAISADGRRVAFASVASNLVAGDTNRKDDVLVRNRETGVTQRVSVGSSGQEADGFSYFPAISPGGRRVAFASIASNLFAGDTNAVPDVFVRNLETGVTRLVSVGQGGQLANGASLFPAICAEWRRVAFESSASNLVAGDTNATSDVFVRISY